MHEFFLDVITVMQSQLWFYLLTVGLVSLCIGSFLNVVIYRLPLMMQREWQTECRVLLADDLKPTKPADTEAEFNLLKPNSTCPKCKTAIKPWQNIPVISWLLLKGRCASCSNPISVRYPIVEMLTAILSLIVAYIFGAPEIGRVSWRERWEVRGGGGRGGRGGKGGEKAGGWRGGSIGGRGRWRVLGGGGGVRWVVVEGW